MVWTRRGVRTPYFLQPCDKFARIRDSRRKRASKAKAPESWAIRALSSENALIHGNESHGGYAGRDIDADLSFDRQRLQREGAAGAAQQHIGSATNGQGSFGAGAGIGSRERAMRHARSRSEHRPDQMSLGDFAQGDAIFVDAAVIEVGRAAFDRGENAVQGLLLHQDQADARRNVTGQRARLDKFLRRSRQDADCSSEDGGSEKKRFEHGLSP